jgi:hypothetical protein
MTEQPEGRAEESKKAAKSNIEQQPQPPEPIDKQDPTEPVKVRGVKEQKGADVGL